MYQLFHCPNCNASLDLGESGAAIVRCDYCHSVVIVPESLRGIGGVGKGIPDEQRPAPKKPLRPAKPAITEAEAAARITHLALTGQQLEAMKLYREAFSAGLKETKEAVEQAAAGLPLPIPEIRLEDEEALPLAAAEEITHLAALGQLEEAARLYRVTFETSHVEAKAAVGQLVEGKSIDVARHRAREESQSAAVRLVSKATSSAPAPFFTVGVLLFIVVVLAVAVGLILIFTT